MRLAKVDDGHSFGQRLKLGMIRRMSGMPVPDIVKVLSYRPELWGRAMTRLTQAVLRGPSAWPVADRELFAAFVSSRNQCVF